jgi:dipeptidyl aminopeptidase/acylaminoacyl peptidase
MVSSIVRSRGLRLLPAVLAALACVATAAAAADVERIPVEAFGKLPLIQDPVLSPDGTQMAAIMEVEGKPVVAVVNIVNREKGTRLVRIGDHRIRWYRWAGSDRVLISLIMKATVSGYDTEATRLVSYEVSSGKATYIGFDSQGFEGDQVIFTAKDGSYILLSLSRQAYWYPSVYRADLATGKMEEVIDPEEPIWAWYADNSGIVRAGVGYEGDHLRVFTREKDGDFFRHAASIRVDELDDEIDTFRISNATNNGFIVTNAKTGRFALYEFDWKTKEIGAPVYEHPEVDIDDFTLTEDDSAVESVTYVDDRLRVVWLDPRLKEVQDEVDAALPGRTNMLLSWSRDRNRFIVWTGIESDPGLLYYYDRAAEQMSRLATPYEGLKGKPLPRMKFVSYKARDGLVIPAYLTLPAGREPKNLPLVLLPHGGPHMRDELGFHFLVQFLANRGYAVLQPNFRGSSGYGTEFLTMGFGQWGMAMQDDLTDGLQWLVREGTVDPKRVCIVGGSYGGYAALMGAIKTPELFRCAISWAGVTDVPAMMQHDKSQLLPERYRRWRNRVRGKGDANLKDVSPVRRAKDVGVPVLLMHGTEDDNVPFRQATEFVKAMQKAGKPIQFIEFEGVEHDLEESDDRIRFLRAVEEFLARHNPAE